MRSLQLSISGDIKATAPLKDELLTFTMICGESDDDESPVQHIRLGGIDDDHHLEWFAAHDLTRDAEIRISFVDSDVVDAPTRRSRDRLAEASKDRERYEDAKRIYFALRGEYEDDSR
ncbi:MAG: hypothetical protein AAFV88_25860 [Planctomycetota bacterium]